MSTGWCSKLSCALSLREHRLVLQAWENRKGGEAVPTGRVKGDSPARGRKPALEGCVFTCYLPQRELSDVADAAVKGLTIQPQDWSRCQLPFSLCLCSLGPLLVALVMRSHVQALLEFCEFCKTGAIDSF